MSNSEDPEKPVDTAGPIGAPEGDQPARMNPEDRREMILSGAVGFFSKHGFQAQTRALSRELNVSQGLIFRYFGSKEELVEAVYQRNFILRWRDEWEVILCDRSISLNDRLQQFYNAYIKAIDDYDWIRISVFSGLSGNALTKRYVETNVEALLEVIATEIAREFDDRHACSLGSERAHELVWHLHSTFIYYLFRKHVFQTRATQSHSVLVETAVDNFVKGLEATYSARPEGRGATPTD